MKAKLIIEGLEDYVGVPSSDYTGEDKVVKVMFDLPSMRGGWWWGKIVDDSNFPEEVKLHLETREGTNLGVLRFNRFDDDTYTMGSNIKYKIIFNQSREYVSHAIG
jgi:hypothetical protein